jgi:hypothetical protein
MKLINSKLILLVFNNIFHYINNIFKKTELDSKSVVKDYLTTAANGKQYKTIITILMSSFPLDIVKSKCGTEFRNWTDKLLKE